MGTSYALRSREIAERRPRPREAPGFVTPSTVAACTISSLTTLDLPLLSCPLTTLLICIEVSVICWLAFFLLDTVYDTIACWLTQL